MSGSGYRMVYVGRGKPGTTKGGYAYEHRVVMERHLGRPLKKGERVHHVNGVKTDNRVENLEVLTHAEHMREHHTQPDGIHPRIRQHQSWAIALVSRGFTVRETAIQLGVSEPSIRKLIAKVSTWKCPHCDRVLQNVRALGVHLRRGHLTRAKHALGFIDIEKKR